MTKYSCRGIIRFVYVAMMLVFGGAFLAFSLLPAFQSGTFRSPGERIAVAVPLGLLFGGAACAGVVGLLNTFTVFLMDGEGIRKLRWNGGTQELFWRDLVRAEPMQDGSGTLMDRQGHRMTVPSAELRYRSQGGRTLQDELAERLANLPEEAKKQVEAPREFRLGQTAPALAAGFLALMLIVCAVTMPLLPTSGPPPPLAFKLGLPAFFLCGALFVGYLGLQFATRVLLLTDAGLIDRSAFGKREIPFTQVIAFTTKDVSTKSGTVEIKTIKSANTTIHIQSTLPNYDRLVQALQERIGGQVTENAPQAMADETRKYLLVNVIGLFMIGCLFGLATHWLGATLQQDAQVTMQRQLNLDAHGKRTTGEVTGVEEHGSKSVSYTMNYNFQVDGKPYSHFSTVSRAVYENQPIGSRIQVDYLPSDPEVSRATLSIAKEKAEEKLHAARGMFLFSWALPFLLGGLGFTQKPRYRPTSAPKRVR